MTKPTNRRRWFRFSLRMLLVVVTVLCVWLGIRANAGRRQREAVEAIQRAGGMVVYDYQYETLSKPTSSPFANYRLNLDAQPPTPSWARAALGDDFFRTVIAVYFNYPKPNITKADFDQIAHLPALKQFVLGPDQPGWKFDGSDLAALAEQNQLEVLQLFGTHVNGAMLARMRSLATLKALSICNCDFDDAAMEQVGKMTNLQYLQLSGTRITDASVPEIQKLTKLKHLYLHETAITDVGLQHLADMKQLVELFVPRTAQVSRSVVRDLQKSLPNTTIF